MSGQLEYEDKKTEVPLGRVETVSSLNKGAADVEGQDDVTGIPIQEVPRVQYTEAENRAVVRKLDRVILPLMCMCYALQYIDRSAMGYAALFTFRKDAHLTASNYQWLSSIYYFGYLFFEPIGARLFQVMSISKLLSGLVVVWGVLLACMAIPREFAPLAAIRFLLGAAESLISPGFILLASRFYDRSEQPLRVGIWYSCQGIGSFIGSMISYGMGHVSTPGLPGWAWIFILVGLVTVVGGIVCWFFLPEDPQSARFLTPHEKLIAIERVRPNMQSHGRSSFKWAQAWEALNPFIDPQGWLLVLIMWSLCLPNGGLANFNKLIVQAMGFSTFSTILVGIPTCLFQVLFPLGASIVVRRYKDTRTYVMCACVLPSFIGFVIQYAVRNVGARLFGYYALTSFVATISLCFGIVGVNVAGSTKRSVVGAMVFVAYASGNIGGPQLYIAGETPAYKTGMLASLISFGITAILCVVLRLHYMRENARRDRLEAENGKFEYEAFSDKTDCQNLAFRYSL